MADVDEPQDAAPKKKSKKPLVIGLVLALLLGGAATGDGSVVDVSLTLALLAAFASIAFVKFAPPSADDSSES